jgi:hypothetical protein
LEKLSEDRRIFLRELGFFPAFSMKVPLILGIAFEKSIIVLPNMEPLPIPKTVGLYLDGMP